MAMCNCGRIAIIRTSWTSLNPGRQFHSCPRPVGQCRRFLGWVDPPMCPRAVGVIPGLLKDVLGICWFATMRLQSTKASTILSGIRSVTKMKKYGREISVIQHRS
ncbi:hypothetical protein R6Q59_012428 [Mikania micrantha]